MRDARFTQGEQWRQQLARGRADAEDAVRGLTDPNLLVDALRVLLSLGADWLDATTELIPPLRQIAKDLQEFKTFGNNVRPAVWLLLARSLAANAFHAVPDPTRVSSAREHLRRAPQWAVREFEDAWLAAFTKAGEEQQRGWLAALSWPLTVGTREDEQTGAIRVAARSAEWRVADVFDIWSDRSHAIELIWGHPPTGLLKHVDFERWFTAVDAWDDVRLVAGALFGEPTRHDRELLLSLLAKAALVFDEDGAWTRRSAAVVLAKQVVEHGNALLHTFGTEEDDRILEVRETELPAFFQRAWDVLLNRRDGVSIALALHAHLISADVNLQDSARSRDATAVARVQLTKALASRKVSLELVQSLWRQRVAIRGDTARTVREAHVASVYVILSALELAEITREPDALLSFVCERIRAADREWKWLPARTLSRTIERFATMWKDHAPAIDSLDRLYDSLEDARRRAERTPHTEGADSALLSSNLALVILLAVLDESAANPAVTERCARRAVRLNLITSWHAEPVLTSEVIVSYALIVLVRMSEVAVTDLLQVVLCDPVFAGSVVHTLVERLGRPKVEELLAVCGTSVELLRASLLEWGSNMTHTNAIKIAEALA